MMTDYPPPPPVKWGRLIAIVAIVIAIPTALISWNQHQDIVAAKATGQNPGERLGPDRAEDLSDLVLHPVAFEKNELPD